MPPARHNTALPPAQPPAGVPRRDPAVRRLALAWRDLTGGRTRGRDLCRRTVLACSGGGDSVGMALGLASAVSNPRGIFMVAHIVHDLRPRVEALADRDTARAMAESLGLPFVEADITVAKERGNAEAAARRLRYSTLAAIAAEHRCHFIATAHHAQDQFESMLMALLRGSGLRGLRGIARARMLPAVRGDSGQPVRLIRPALDLDTSDLRRLCDRAGFEWAQDATNADTKRLRAALRHDIIPQLEALRPGAAHRAARSAQLLSAAESLIAERTRRLLQAGRGGGEADAFAWPREALRAEQPIVLGALLRDAAAQLTARRAQDRLASRTIAPAVRAVRDTVTDPRRFSLAGCTLTVDVRRVCLTPPRKRYEP